MSLADVVAQEVLPLPTETEAIIMKLFSGADRLKSRREKAVKDFDDAMKLAPTTWVRKAMKLAMSMRGRRQ
jgi:hypothetical protein